MLAVAGIPTRLVVAGIPTRLVVGILPTTSLVGRLPQQALWDWPTIGNLATQNACLHGMVISTGHLSLIFLQLQLILRSISQKMKAVQANFLLKPQNK